MLVIQCVRFRDLFLIILHNEVEPFVFNLPTYIAGQALEQLEHASNRVIELLSYLEKEL